MACTVFTANQEQPLFRTATVWRYGPTELLFSAEHTSQIILGYGGLSGGHREYEKDGASVPVALWTMKDSTGAYGLYSFYREPGTATLQDGYRVAVWPNRVIVQRGAYVADHPWIRRAFWRAPGVREGRRQRARGAMDDEGLHRRIWPVQFLPRTRNSHSSGRLPCGGMAQQSYCSARSIRRRSSLDTEGFLAGTGSTRRTAPACPWRYGR